MEDRLDLDQIERETWAHQLKDGIFDITFGWLFMWANFMDHQIYFGLPETAATILHLLPLVVYFLGRKYISEPRIGKVRHNLLTSPIRKKTLIPFLIPLVIFGGLYLWDKKVHLGWFVFGGLDLTGPLLFTAAIVISSAVMAVAMKN
ncbi:MAG: hypothetical protein H8E46_00175, partial [FCB group bacterium]|nr:hypothetical protein [FCB group bacterium]